MGGIVGRGIIVIMVCILLTVLVALYKLTIGGLILSQRRYVKLGLIGGILFNILLAPMWIGQAIFNLVFGALHVPLFRYEFLPYGLKEKQLNPPQERGRL